MTQNSLLKELVEAGLLGQETADKVLKEAAALKKDPEELIYGRRLADEATVAKIKSGLLGIPYKAADADAIPQEVLDVISFETSRAYKMAPLSLTKEMLVVGMVNPTDAKAQEALRFIAKEKRLNLGVYLITPGDLEKIWRRYSSYRSEIAEALKAVRPDAGDNGWQKIVQLEEGVAVVGEAPVIKIVSSTLREAVGVGASDIHIEPQRDRLRIRFRVDGDLEEVSSLPLALHQPIVSRVKVLSNLKIDENRIPQDGRFRTVIFGRDIDFRISTFPTPAGEKAAIRVLDPTIGLKSLENLGLSGKNAAIVKEGLNRPFGMILLTGPTGSGKTTTLYALLQSVNKEDVNIVSLEDPVEYFIDGVNQSQVKPEIGYDFASGLRQILRQDPDVIMVGEIRDNETAALAVHAALTGHIVFSTLHTNNAVGVIPRLADMKVEPFLLPSSLNLMIAQRLVSRICQKCKKPEKAPPEAQAVIKRAIVELPPGAEAGFKEPYEIYRAPGCSACKNKGVAGRIAVFEVLKMTAELAAVVNAGIAESEILKEAKRQGAVSLRQDGVLKALAGEVLFEEVLKETAEM